MMKEILFFDLDGTITDPSDGITNCIIYALEKLNVCPPPKESLVKYIGPPLYSCFMELLNTDDIKAGENAVNIYRERFSVKGLLENTPYKDIDTALLNLKSCGYKMFVCTSKPEVFASKILKHFGLDVYFEKIYGSGLDGTHVEKDSLLAHIIKTEKLNPEKCAMIGDRIFDVDGAIKNNVTPYGVSYGFGSETELLKAEKIFRNPLEIKDFFCKQK